MKILMICFNDFWSLLSGVLRLQCRQEDQEDGNKEQIIIFFSTSACASWVDVLGPDLPLSLISYDDNSGV